MPNWCNNTLIVSGISPNAFIADNQTPDQVLSFSKIAPRPNEEDENWYNWNCSNWGTKWDCDSPSYEIKSDNIVIYDFMTAWGPPIPWLEKAVAEYPQLNFELEFNEGGNDFWGKIVYKQGEIVEDISDSLSNHAWEVMGFKLVENFRQILLKRCLVFDTQFIQELRDSLEDGIVPQNILSALIEPDISDQNRWYASYIMVDICHEICNQMEKILKSLPIIIRSFRKLVQARRKTKSNTLNQLVEQSYTPPQGGIPIYKRGGSRYREALQNFSKFSN